MLRKEGSAVRIIACKTQCMRVYAYVLERKKRGSVGGWGSKREGGKRREGRDEGRKEEMKEGRKDM